MIPRPASAAISHLQVPGRRREARKGSAVLQAALSEHPKIALGLPSAWRQILPMPLHWKIAPLEQMVVCVSEGAVTKDELMAYFKALEAAGASHYRKMLGCKPRRVSSVRRRACRAHSLRQVAQGAGHAGADGHLHRLVGETTRSSGASASYCGRAGGSGRSRPFMRRAAGWTAHRPDTRPDRPCRHCRQATSLATCCTAGVVPVRERVVSSRLSRVASSA